MEYFLGIMNRLGDVYVVPFALKSERAATALWSALSKGLADGYDAESAVITKARHYREAVSFIAADLKKRGDGRVLEHFWRKLV